MKKIATTFIILIVILALPYILGRFIQYKFEEEIASLNQELTPILKQEVPLKLDYQAGWFNSTAIITVNNISFVNQINHTPYTLFKLAKIETTTQFPQDIAKPLQALFDKQEPYKLTTTIGFTGNTLFNLFSPAIGEKTTSIKNNEVIINWQGLTLDANLEKNHLTYLLKLPKLALSKVSETSLLINNLQADTAQLTINKINIALTALAIQLDTIKATKDSTNDQDSYSLTFGKINLKNTTTSFSADRVDINLKKSADDTYQSIFSAQPITVNQQDRSLQVKLNYHNEQLVSAVQEAINYRATHQLSAINLQYPHYDNFLNNLTLTYQIERIPKKQLLDFLKSYIKFVALSTRNNKQDKQVMEQQSEVEQMAINLAITTLRQTPAFKLNILLNGDKGDASLTFQASLKTPDRSSISIKTIMQNLKHRLNINFSVKVTKTLLDSVVQSANLGDSKRNQLKQLLQKLPMIESEDQYQANIIFENSMFYVNGHADPHFIQTYLPILKEYLP